MIAYPHYDADDLTSGIIGHLTSASALEGNLIGNNVFLGAPKYSSGVSVAVNGAWGLYYSYMDAWFIGMDWSNLIPSIGGETIGLMFNATGPGTDTRNAYQIPALVGTSGTWRLMDLLVLRHCNTAAAWSVGMDGTAMPAGVVVQYEHLTIGFECAEDLTIVSTVSGCMTISGMEDDRGAGSYIRDVVCASGDGTSAWEGFGMLSSTATGTSFDISNFICSSCDTAGFTCQQDCLINVAGTTTVDQDTITEYNQESQSSLKVRTSDTMELRGESPAFASTVSEHMGARYSGVINPFDTLAQFDIPFEAVSYRSTGEDVPLKDEVPAPLKGKIFTTTGGGSGPVRTF